MKIIAKNKKAYREAHILEKYEAGIVLTGTEIKSIRAGKITIAQAYVRIDGSAPYLVGANIAEYHQGSYNNHEPERKRRLLLHKREIDKLRSKVDEKGLTLLPLCVYLSSRGFAKVEIGLARGKKLHDKRHDLKKRDIDRDIRRQTKEFGRRD